MEIKVVGVNGEIEQPREMVETDPTPIYEDQQLVNRSVAEMFDLKPSEISQYQGKLNTLIDYAKTQTDDHSREGILWAIRELQYKVGTPPLGEKMINYLTKFCYIALESKRLEEEKNKYLKNSLK